MKTLANISKYITILVLAGLLSPMFSNAQETLTIQDLSVKRQENTETTITWRTNYPARFLFEYGQTKDYGLSIKSTEYTTSHKVVLGNLASEKIYHFRIIAFTADDKRTVSFDQVFKTTKKENTKPPELVDYRTVFTAKNNVTLMLETNEHVDVRIDYWKQGKPQTKQSVYWRTGEQNIMYGTIYNLQPATTYEYSGVLTDKDDNKIYLQTRSVTTLPANTTLEKFKFTNVQPVDHSSPLITETSVTTTFRTTRPALCEVQYRKGTSGAIKTVRANRMRNWSHEIPFDALNPGTQYQYKLVCTSINNQTLQSKWYNVVTKGNLPSVTAVNTTTATTFADGKYQLVKTADSPKIYAIIGELKHHIRNPHIFADYGFTMDQIKVISQKQLDTYKPLRLAKDPVTNQKYYLYLDKNMKKAHANNTVVNSYDYNRTVHGVRLSTLDLEYYKNVWLVKTTDDPTVYYIQNGIKQPIKSWDDFVAQGWEAWQISEINKTDLDSYATGLFFATH